MRKRVGSSSDANDKPNLFRKHGGGIKITINKKRAIRLWTTFRRSKSSSVSFLKLIGTKVARVLRLVSMRKSRSSPCKVSSSSLAMSRSHADQIDSHRAQAIEDCIEFLNSSSLQRSNSVSSTSCC